MGLDMYLEARKYVSKYDYSPTDRTENNEFITLSSLAPAGASDMADFAGGTVSISVGYWRKANAIHGWFVDNVQNGVDECQSSYVEREQLIELRDLCKEVLSVPAGVTFQDHAADLLPTQAGFFFGSYEYDEWYMEDIKKTIEIIDHVLTVFPENDYNWSFYYHSSW